MEKSLILKAWRTFLEMDSINEHNKALLKTQEFLESSSCIQQFLRND